VERAHSNGLLLPQVHTAEPPLRRDPIEHRQRDVAAVTDDVDEPCGWKQTVERRHPTDVTRYLLADEALSASTTNLVEQGADELCERGVADSQTERGFLVDTEMIKPLETDHLSQQVVGQGQIRSGMLAEYTARHDVGLEENRELRVAVQHPLEQRGPRPRAPTNEDVRIHSRRSSRSARHLCHGSASRTPRRVSSAITRSVA